MLIKDNDGDWGMCVAVWRGMKKGTPGIPGNNKCNNERSRKFRKQIRNRIKLRVAFTIYNE